MDNGLSRKYTDLSENDVIKKGDQLRDLLISNRWGSWDSVDMYEGEKVGKHDSRLRQYRRPIAHYATPKEKVVEYYSGDATISKTETDEWEPCQKTISMIHSKLIDAAGDLMGGYHDDHELQIFQHGMVTQANVVEKLIILSQSQIEERERNTEVNKMLDVLPDKEMASVEWAEHVIRIVRALYDAGYQLKDNNCD